MSWYRLYRPTTVAGLHLTSVRQTLQQLMKQGKLPHVLLFAGPKGTGKTSTARILAAMVNDPSNAALIDHLFFAGAAPTAASDTEFHEPDQTNELVKRIQQGTSLVVQELDAASNRGIDDVRQLKERVALAPQEGKVGVYILDEAHMLTTEAFNALLKLLEEPPAHALFILATTEQHKIPATIVSRATVIPFTKATPAELLAALKTVAEAEQVESETAALQIIAERADGSFRDGVKLLEQIASQFKSITLDALSQTSFGSVGEDVEHLVKLVLAKDAIGITAVMAELRERAVDQTFLVKSLLNYLHTHLLRSLGVQAGTAIATERVCHFLLSELAQVPTTATPIPLLHLEVKLLELVFRAQNKRPESSNTPSSSGGTAGGSSTKTQDKAKVSVSTSPKSAVAMATEFEVSERSLAGAVAAPETIASAQFVSDNLQPVSLGDAHLLLEKWQEFVQAVTAKNASIAALLRSARPTLNAQGIPEVQVFYKFHKEQLQQPKFQQMLEECAKPLVGGQMKLEFTLVETQTTTTSTQVSVAAVESVSPAAATSPTVSAGTNAPSSGDDLTVLAAEALM